MGRWGPVLVLAAMVATYFGVFGFLVYRQQSNFGTFGFDIGIRDQGIWLVAHGHTPFMTVRGLDFFAENVEPISLLFVPFYWLGAGPHFLILVHTAVISLGAVPLWLLGRDRFQRPWIALIPPLAYLLYPAVHWVTWWAYHPDSMAITPLLFAWWLAARRRWGWYAVAAGLALACKEDVALAVFMLGLAVAFALRPVSPEAPADGRTEPATSNGPDGGTEPAGPRAPAQDRARDPARSARKIGLVTAAVALAWFLICTQAIIPWRNHHVAPFYESFFPSFGHSTPEILYNIVRHPSRVTRLATLHDRLHYDAQVFLPVAFLPLFGLPALLVAGPQFGINTIVEVQHGSTIESQYASLIIAGVFLGTVEGMAWLAGGGAQRTRTRRRRRRRHRRAGLTRPWVLWLLTVALVASSVASTSVWGLSPISKRFHSGLWAAHPDRAVQLATALEMLRPSDGVSVAYYVAPHVTHRRYVYEFPNPWVNSNYGNSDNDLGRPEKVNWLILDRQILGEADAALLARLTQPGGAFHIVEDNDGIVAAQRVSPG
jgi:uncharacterized membrane protein